MMRSILSLLCLLALPAAALAQETAPDAPPADEEGSVDEGLNLLEEGSKLILRGLMNEIEPKLKDLHRDLGTAMAEMEPVVRDLMRMIGDIRNYDPPEMMPNGDIILRRKTPLPDAAPKADGDGQEGAIDL